MCSQNHRKTDLREKKKLHDFAHHGNLSGIQKILESNPQWLNANLEVEAVFAIVQLWFFFANKRYFEQALQWWLFDNVVSPQVGDGHALIHRCATRGHLDCIEWLLEQEGIDLDLLNDVCRARVVNILIALL